MKLASLKHRRDGKLILVSRDLTQAVDASDIALTLQDALDEWEPCRHFFRHVMKRSMITAPPVASPYSSRL